MRLFIDRDELKRLKREIFQILEKGKMKKVIYQGPLLVKLNISKNLLHQCIYREAYNRCGNNQKTEVCALPEPYLMQCGIDFG